MISRFSRSASALTARRRKFRKSCSAFPLLYRCYFPFQKESESGFCSEPFPEVASSCFHILNRFCRLAHINPLLRFYLAAKIYKSGGQERLSDSSIQNLIFMFLRFFVSSLQKLCKRFFSFSAIFI